MKVWAWSTCGDGVSLAPGAKKPVKDMYGNYSSDLEHFIEGVCWRRMGGPKLEVGAKPIRVGIAVKEIK